MNVDWVNPWITREGIDMTTTADLWAPQSCVTYGRPYTVEVPRKSRVCSICATPEFLESTFRSDEFWLCANCTKKIKDLLSSYDWDEEGAEELNKTTVW